MAYKWLYILTSSFEFIQYKKILISKQVKKLNSE